MRIETFLVFVDLAMHRSPVLCSAVSACFVVLCGRWFYEGSARTSETRGSVQDAFGVRGGAGGGMEAKWQPLSVRAPGVHTAVSHLKELFLCLASTLES